MIHEHYIRTDLSNKNVAAGLEQLAALCWQEAEQGGHFDNLPAYLRDPEAFRIGFMIGVGTAIIKQQAGELGWQLQSEGGQKSGHDIDIYGDGSG